MIDLLTLKRYEESNIFPLDPASPRRKWWNNLPFDARHDIAWHWANGRDTEVDRRKAKLNHEAYGDNS